MNNEPIFANKVRHLLNQGSEVTPMTAERLRAARERALAAHRPARQWALAWASAMPGSGGREIDDFAGFSLRVILAVALVVLTAMTLANWQQNQRLAEIEEIDASLLTDDLPIDALLDRGFQEWLKKQPTP